MQVHIWEDGKVECSATLSGPKYVGAQKVEFIFSDANSAEIGRVAAKLAKEEKTLVCTGEWPATKTEGNDLFYRASYRVEVDGAALPDRPTEVLVWAKTVEITAKDADGAAVKEALCRLTQGAPPEGWGTSVVITDEVKRTDDTGVIKLDLPYPGEVIAEWKRPHVLVGGTWVKEKGKKREAKLAIAFRAQLAFPIKNESDASKPSRQYVNLVADTKHPEYGSKLQIKVVAKVSAEAEAGDKVYVKAKFDGANNTRTKSTGGYAKGETFEATAELDAEKKAVIELELGQAGGDKIEISVGGTAAANDDKVTVETWRKIFYELMAPKTMQGKLVAKKLASDEDGYELPAATSAWYKERLDKIFVEYVCFKSHLFEDAAATEGTIMDSAFIKAGAGEKVWVIGGKLANSDPASFGAATPAMIHMRLCDKAVSPEAPAAFSTSAPHLVAATTAIPVPSYLYEISLDDGSDSITDMTWEADIDPVANPTHPAVEAGAAKKGAAPREWFVHVDHKKLEIRLGGEPAGFVGAASDTKCPVKVSFKWALAGGINGNAGDGRQLMVLRRPPKAVASTICHELGHSMGLTVKSAGTFAKKPPHGLAYPDEVPAGDVYDGKGHTGTHCAHGVADKDAESYKKEQGDCIMFGQGGDEAEPKRANFCATCILYGKARNLSDVRSRFKTRDDKDC